MDEQRELLTMNSEDNPNPMLADYDRARAYLRRHLMTTELDGGGVTKLLNMLKYFTEQMCDLVKPKDEHAEHDRMRALAHPRHKRKEHHGNP